MHVWATLGLLLFSAAFFGAAVWTLRGGAERLYSNPKSSIALMYGKEEWLRQQRFLSMVFIMVAVIIWLGCALSLVLSGEFEKVRNQGALNHNQKKP